MDGKLNSLPTIYASRMRVINCCVDINIDISFDVVQELLEFHYRRINWSGEKFAACYRHIMLTRHSCLCACQRFVLHDIVAGWGDGIECSGCDICRESIWILCMDNTRWMNRRIKSTIWKLIQMCADDDDFYFAVFVALSTFGAVNGILLTSSRLFYAGACEGQMPEILTMIQIQRFTPTPAVLAMALLSMLYLTVSDIFALINYVGFATWVNSRIPIFGLPICFFHIFITRI